MQRLVFVPIAMSERSVIADGHALTDRRAFSVTPELLAALEYGQDDLEDAEHACLVIASVAGLTELGERVVLVAEAPEAGVVVDAANGEHRLARLDPRHVVAFFTDEKDADVAPAIAAASGLGIDDAWETPQVQALLASADLLWHAAEELKTTED